MNTDIKSELHKLVDNCTNELLLSEARSLLQSENEVTDWWDELSEKDKSLVMESEAQYNQGKYVSNHELNLSFKNQPRK